MNRTRRFTKYFMFTLVISFLFLSNTLADDNARVNTCDYAYQAKILNLATNITAEYEIEETEDMVYDPYMGDSGLVVSHKAKLKIYNISKEFYISVKKTDGEGEKFYRYTDAVFEVIEIDIGDMLEVSNYTISIYSANTDCNNKLLRSISVTVPRYNDYNLLSECDDNPDFYYCQKYTTLDSFTYDNFYYNYNSYVEHKKEEEEKKSSPILDFIYEYKYVFGTLIVISISGVFIFIRYKNKRKKSVLC